MNKFEQLIEYVINDEEAKARELFHDIVVAKSREIYENIMAEEAQEELDEASDEELDEAAEEELDEGSIGGDASDDLINDVETEEQSDMNMEGEESDVEFDDGAEEAGDELTHDIEQDHDDGGSEPASKDDILNLEDKLDQLMAEFEDLMGDDDMGDGDGFGPDEGGDAIEMDDTEEMGMMEAVTLKAAPKPVTSEEGGINKKSTVAANAGAKGPVGSTVKPVRAGGEMGGKHDTSAYSNTTKDLISDFQNKAGSSMKGQKPATKAHTAQATGVNTRSPVAKA
jgi:hypothetical protein